MSRGVVSELSPDDNRRAEEALAEVYRDYGLPGLASASVLHMALASSLPDTVPAGRLIRTAAAHGVAAQLSSRLAGGMPAATAVAEVAAALSTATPAGTPMDADEGAWATARYAYALGHPLATTPAAAPVAAPFAPQHERGTAAPDTPPHHYDPTHEFVGPGFNAPPRPRPPRNHMPLVIGLVVAAVVGAGALVVVLTSHPACRTAACTAPARPSRSAAKVLPSPVVPTTPGPVVTSSIEENGQHPGAPVALANRMPGDIAVSSCLTTGDYAAFLSGVVAYYACTEGNDSTLPGMLVWGYQFADERSYLAGVDSFNSYIHFTTSSAGDRCPPGESNGYAAWWRQPDPSATLGHLECYSDQSSQPNYVWTDDVEFTIIVAEARPTQTFTDLDSWWQRNNRSGNGA